MFSLFQVQKVIECGTINVADEELAQKIKKKCTVHEIKWYITFFKMWNFYRYVLKTSNPSGNSFPPGHSHGTPCI